MDSSQSRLEQSLRKLRWPVALVVIVISCVSGWGISRLTFNDNYSSIFRTSGAPADTGSGDQDENVCLIIVEGEQLLTADGVETLRQLHNDVTEIEGVQSVRSLHSARQPRRIGRYMPPLFPGPDATAEEMEKVRKAAAGHPLLSGILLTKDQKSALMLAHLDPQAERVSQIEPIVERIKAAVENRLSETSWNTAITGPPVVRMEMLSALLRDQWKFNLLSPLISLIIAWFVFRRIAAVIIVSLSAFSGVLWSLGAMGIAGESLNIVNSLLPTLTLTIGLTSSVHLLNAIRHEMDESGSRFSSILGSIRRVGPACLLATLTTVVGFASLAFAELEIIARFGLACASSMALTFIAAITIVPLLTSTPLGKHIAAKRPLRTPGTQGSSLTATQQRSIWHRWSDSWVNLIFGRRRLITVLALIFTLSLVWGSRNIQPDITTAEALPNPGEARTALQRAEHAFGGAFPVYITLRWSEDSSIRLLDLLAALDEVHEIVGQEELLGPAISLRNLVDSLPGDSTAEKIKELRYLPREELARFLRPSERTAIVAAWSPDAGSRRMKPAFARIQRQLTSLKTKHSGLTFELTGSTVATSRLGNSMIQDLVRSLFLAVPVTVVLLGAAFRSWKLALISLPINIFPLAATGAMLWLLGIPVQIGTATVFSICFGVAVDDTIHFLMHWRRHYQQSGDGRLALRHAMRHVGGALVSTTVIIVLGCSVVTTSDIPSVSLFGTCFIFGMVLALVADLVFLPSLLAVAFSQSAPIPARRYQPVATDTLPYPQYERTSCS